mmetsp:Transcript_13569/g.39289  ORF Transcript_13569/g.39289 Transcript_13569/m.39289 type:complete len:246 (+) Transcript_13569:1731-2468(+)
MADCVLSVRSRLANSAVDIMPETDACSRSTPSWSTETLLTLPVPMSLSSPAGAASFAFLAAAAVSSSSSSFSPSSSSSSLAPPRVPATSASLLSSSPSSSRSSSESPEPAMPSPLGPPSKMSSESISSSSSSSSCSSSSLLYAGGCATRCFLPVDAAACFNLEAAGVTVMAEAATGRCFGGALRLLPDASAMRFGFGAPGVEKAMVAVPFLSPSASPSAEPFDRLRRRLRFACATSTCGSAMLAT